MTRKKNKRPTPKVQKKATNQPNNSKSQSHIISHEQSYEGPIPPASELGKYNQVVPNAAERILVMAEKNQEHQIKSEAAIIKAKKLEVTLGQIFALIVVLSSFALSTFAIIKGYPTVATVVGGTTVVGLAVAFITGRKKDNMK